MECTHPVLYTGKDGELFCQVCKAVIHQETHAEAQKQPENPHATEKVSKSPSAKRTAKNGK
jgi:uncharacterized Zn finger protein (UPF0148 family)